MVIIYYLQIVFCQCRYLVCADKRAFRNRIEEKLQFRNSTEPLLDFHGGVRLCRTVDRSFPGRVRSE